MRLALNGTTEPTYQALLATEENRAVIVSWGVMFDMLAGPDMLVVKRGDGLVEEIRPESDILDRYHEIADEGPSPLETAVTKLQAPEYIPLTENEARAIAGVIAANTL